MKTLHRAYLFALAFAALVSRPAAAEGPEFKVDPFWPKSLPNN